MSHALGYRRDGKRIRWRRRAMVGALLVGLVLTVHYWSSIRRTAVLAYWTQRCGTFAFPPDHIPRDATRPGFTGTPLQGFARATGTTPSLNWPDETLAFLHERRTKSGRKQLVVIYSFGPLSGDQI